MKEHLQGRAVRWRRKSGMKRFSGRGNNMQTGPKDKEIKGTKGSLAGGRL